MRDILKSSRGASLVIALLAVVVFAMLGAVVYRINQFQAREVLYQKRLAQAQYIAEAGMEDALRQYYSNPMWNSGFSKKAFAGGYYTVTVSTDASPTIKSSGYSASIPLFGRAVKTVSATVNFFYSTAALPGAGFAIQADNSIQVKSVVDAYNPAYNLSPTVFYFGGNMWSNRMFQTSAGALVRGNVYYYKTASNLANTVQGAVLQTTYTITLPYHYCSTCSVSSANNNLTGISPSSVCYNSGTMFLTVNAGQTCTLAAGTYFFKGVTVNGRLNLNTSTAPVKMYFTGNFSTGSNCIINNISKIPNRFLVYGGPSGNNYDIGCIEPLHAYLEDANSDWNLRSELFGRLYARNVTIFQGANMHTDVSDLSGYISHVSWSSGTWTQNYKRQ